MGTLYAIAAGGNWNTIGTWSSTSSAGASSGTIPTATDDVIFDAGSTGAVVVNHATQCVAKTLTCQSASNIITFSASCNAIISGNVTFFAGMGANLSGTGTLDMKAAGALNMAGNTFPGNLRFISAVTYTISTAATVTGLVSFTAACRLNYTTAKATDTLTCNGGAYSSAQVLTGTAKLVLGGGTLSTSAANTYINNDVDLAGTITIGTYYACGGSNTTAYVSGTVDTSTNSSTIYIVGNHTLNTPTANMSWYNLSCSFSGTLTLTSSITITNTLATAGGALAIATSDITTKNLNTSGGNITGAGRTITMTGSGGTWSSAGTYSVATNLTINSTSTTISGTVTYRTGTLLYTAGAVTTTGSTLSINLSCTLNTAGITWNHVYLGQSATITLGSDLTANTASSQFTVLADQIITFSGAFNVQVYDLIMGTGSELRIVSGQTFTIDNSMTIAYTYSDPVTVRSTSAGTHCHLTYSGTVSNQKIMGANFTDVDASTSAMPIYDYQNGTISGCTNIVGISPANIVDLFGVIT